MLFIYSSVYYKRFPVSHFRHIQRSHSSRIYVFLIIPSFKHHVLGCLSLHFNADHVLSLEHLHTQTLNSLLFLHLTWPSVIQTTMLISEILCQFQLLTVIERLLSTVTYMYYNLIYFQVPSLPV